MAAGLQNFTVSRRAAASKRSSWNWSRDRRSPTVSRQVPCHLKKFYRYLALDQTLMSATVHITGDEVSIALPRPLFKLPAGATLGDASVDETNASCRSIRCLESAEHGEVLHVGRLQLRVEVLGECRHDQIGDLDARM